MVDIRNRQRREKGKSRVSFLADQSAILMSLCSLRMKGKFWSILLLLFYVEGIYLPTLQQQARLWQSNYYLSLWFTQMCLSRSQDSYLQDFALTVRYRSFSILSLNSHTSRRHSYRGPLTKQLIEQKSAYKFG